MPDTTTTTASKPSSTAQTSRTRISSALAGTLRWATLYAAVAVLGLLVVTWQERQREQTARAATLEIDRARDLLTAGRPAEALRSADAALAAAPDAVSARSARAAALLRLDRPAEARATLEGLSPEHLGGERARLLGLALARSGAPEAAIPVLTRARRDGLLDNEGALALAGAQAAVGDTRRAAEEYAALERDPRAGAHGARAAEALGRLLLAGAGTDPARLQEAARCAESASRRGAACYDLLIEIYLALGEREVAQAVADAALADGALEASRREAVARALRGRSGS